MTFRAFPHRRVRKSKKYRAKGKKFRKSTSQTSTKKYIRKYNKNTSNMLNINVPYPFPPQLKLKQNWAETSVDLAQATPGGPSIGGMLRLSSAWDPALSPVLNQESVQWHDLYSRYYSEYKVTYVLINILARNTGTNDVRLLFGIADDQNVPGNITANMNEMQMQNYTKTRILESDQGSKYNRAYYTFKFDVTNWTKRMNVDPEDHASIVATNPAKYPVLWYAIESENPAVTGLVKLDITMQFYNTYSRRNENALMQIN